MKIRSIPFHSILSSIVSLVRAWLPASAGLLLLGACSNGSHSGNHAPIVTIDSPFTGNSFAPEDEIELVGSALDPEEGTLGGTSLVWSSDRDGTLGTGESLTVGELTLGLHAIRLTATDAAGASGSAVVHLRVASATSASPRAGETNPYAGRLQRTPAKLDDELVLVGRSSANDQELLGIVDAPVVDYAGPSSTPTEPRITARRDGLVPVAAAAGRPLRSRFHKAAIVQRANAGSAFELELVGLRDPGDELFAAYDFQPPFPDGPLDVAVADLDAFEETTGVRALEPPDVNVEYHDEVALAFADTLAGQLVARVEVLSFEDVSIRPDPAAPAPGPTSVTTIWTTQPMHPASRVVVLHGDNLLLSTQVGVHFVVAYVDAQKRVALDVFRYVHTRADPHTPDPRTDERTLEFSEHAILTSPLADSVVAAGGWDVAVGRGRQLGIDQLATFDFIVEVHNSGGDYVEQVWKLENLDGQLVPANLGQQSGEFARIPAGSGGAGSAIGMDILPTGRVRVQLGRIVDQVSNRCEAVGLLVLADTNRGPVVQSMTAFIEEPFVGTRRFGPVNETPAWPSPFVIRNRADTNEPTLATLAAGGLVSERNGLVDYRGNPTGTADQFADDCENVASAPLLGPMPSFYVAEPEASALHAVTLSLGATNGVALTVPMDPALDERTILLAADADGDTAYYDAVTCAGSAGDCRRLFLGDAELHYVVEDVETMNVLLQQPPKHVDYLRALGGIVDVSMRDGFFAEFEQTDTASGSITRKLKTDWTLGAKLGLGLGEPKEKDYESSFEMSIDLEHKSVQERFSTNEVALSLTQTTGAVDDDVLWSKRQTIDFWRFPAQGGRRVRDASAPDELPANAWMEISIPSEPELEIGPGTLNEDYQPTYTVGNILSYPTFAGGADDLGDLFGFLGSYVPSDEDGTRRCKPLADGDVNGCIAIVNGALERVAEVLAGDEFVGGEFERLSAPIDVANVLEVGGISYVAELEFQNTIKNGRTVTNNDTIKAEVKGKIPLEVAVEDVPMQFGEIEAELRAEASFENARVSENSVGSKTKIGLHLPADIPVERSYRIRPSFGYTPGGGLKVSYQVNTDGAASTFWERSYGAADPALNLPHRIVRTGEGFRLGTDFTRDRMKGFFVRDGKDVDPFAPDQKKGELLTEVPHAGDPVQLQVEVSNLSVATSVDDLEVAFAVQVYAGGEAVGEPIPIGRATLDFLPRRGQFPGVPNAHVANAYVVWDTTGFGPPAGQALITYLVRVTLDPNDRIPNETHELRDRFADPLLGPSGAPLDGLEKGQNNTGWAMVRIAPSLAEELRAGPSSAGHAAAARKSPADIRVRLAGRDAHSRAAPIHGRVGEPLALSFELSTSATERDYGSLQVFDGDPAAGGLRILARTVQGIAQDGEREDFVWRPREAGRRVLYAVYSGTRPGFHPQVQVPVIIE